jgi:hypothetical protein
MTGHRGREVNTPASYSVGPGFKSRPRKPAMVIEVFHGFLSPSRLMLPYYLKLRHDRFLPNLFPFIWIEFQFIYIP